MRYARLVEWGARLGLVVLVASFAAYVTEWLPAHVPVSELSGLWSLPVGEYLRATGSPTGWGWLALLHKGDMLALAGIGILAGCSVLALLALVPLYSAAKDRAFAFLCVLEAAVLLVAASGVFSE